MKNQIAKLAFIALAAVGTAAFAQSQDPAPAPAPAPVQQHQVDPQKQLNHLTRKLALTADQQNQILPVLTDRQQQAAAIRNDASLSNKDRHQKMMALRNDSDAKIHAILTDTQRTAYDQMQQEARERARSRKQTTVQQ